MDEHPDTALVGALVAWRLTLAADPIHRRGHSLLREISGCAVRFYLGLHTFTQRQVNVSVAVRNDQARSDNFAWLTAEVRSTHPISKQPRWYIFGTWHFAQPQCPQTFASLEEAAAYAPYWILAVDAERRLSGRLLG